MAGFLELVRVCVWDPAGPMFRGRDNVTLSAEEVRTIRQHLVLALKTEDLRRRTMRIGFDAQNDCDENGNPTGGSVRGTGFSIDWQNGPLGRGADRKEPNGAFVEDVIDAARQRIKFYQEASQGRFACPENALALRYLDMALEALDQRTRQREARQVEGTHTA